jgi:hypothetical protein
MVCDACHWAESQGYLCEVCSAVRAGRVSHGKQVLCSDTEGTWHRNHVVKNQKGSPGHTQRPVVGACAKTRLASSASLRAWTQELALVTD